MIKEKILLLLQKRRISNLKLRQHWNRRFWNVILSIERNFQDISIKNDIEVLIQRFSFNDSN
jgi:hypothetical protein